MNLKLYKSFSKKKNSTARPTSTPVEKTVRMKEHTSIENPVFLIDGIDLDVNYCKFSDHYYFIDDIVLGNNNIYELHCSQDVLATYKDIIGSNSFMVARSASDFDLNIIDPMIPQKTTISHDVQYSNDIDSQANPFMDINTGCYAVKMVSGGISGVYIVQAGQIDSLLSQFIGPGKQPEDLQYLVGVSWLPLSYTFLANYGTEVGRIVFNDTFAIETAVAWILVKNKITLPTLTLDFHTTERGYVGFYGDFRDWVPSWTQAKLRVLGDYIAIDPSLLRNAITVRVVIDPVAGDITVSARAGNYPIAYTSKHIAVDRQVSGTAFNANKLTQDVLQAGATSIGASIAAGVKTANPYVAAGVGAVTLATNIANMSLNQAYYFHPAVMGTNGSASIIPFIGTIDLHIRQYAACTVPFAVVGRPLNDVRRIDTLSGFVQCTGASISVDGLGNDKDAINSYLNDGFFYE